MNDTSSQQILIIPIKDGGYKFYPQDAQVVYDWLDYMRGNHEVNDKECGVI